MKKKKGFTLVELLAVVVILAIIMVIAVPKILKVIENSERKAFSESAGLMARAAQLKYSQANLTSSIGDETYIYENGELTSESPELTFKGDKPFKGTIVQKNGRVTLAIISKNKKWCAIKNEGQKLAKVYKIGDEIKEEDCKIGYTGEENPGEGEVDNTCFKDITIESPNSSGYYTNSEYIFSINDTNTEAKLESSNLNLTNDDSVCVPKTLNGIPVTALGGGAYTGKSFKKLIISSTIKTIDALPQVTIDELDLTNATNLETLNVTASTINSTIDASNSKKLTYVNGSGARGKGIILSDLPNLKEIKDLNHYENVVISDLPSLEKLGDILEVKNLTIKNLPKLSSIDMMDHSNPTEYENGKLIISNLPNLSNIGNYNAKGFSSVVMDGLPNVTTIPQFAFYENNITSIENIDLPNLQKIEDGAFVYNNIEKLDLTKYPKLKELGAYAFYDNPIKCIKLNEILNDSITNLPNNDVTFHNIFGVYESDVLDKCE